MRGGRGCILNRTSRKLTPVQPCLPRTLFVGSVRSATLLTDIEAVLGARKDEAEGEGEVGQAVVCNRSLAVPQGFFFAREPHRRRRLVAGV